MKKIVSSLIVSMFVAFPAVAGNETLEQKVATIDAGRYLQETDSSVVRAKALLSDAALVYRVTPVQAADIAAKGKELARDAGISVGVMDILDGALMACEKTCSIEQLRNFVAAYVTVRQATRQTHQQAVRGLLLLDGSSAKPKTRG